METRIQLGGKTLDRRLLLLTIVVVSSLASVCGCTSQDATSEFAELESQVRGLRSKIDEILRKLDEEASKEPMPDERDQSRLIAKVDELLSRLPPVPKEVDTSKLTRSSTSELAWYLLTNDPKEKREIALRRVERSSQHREVTRESIQELVRDVEAFNVILNAPELLDAELLQQVENARNRLVDLLRSEIPGVVKKLDQQALKSTDHPEAKRLWAESSAVLGFYPSSNDPIEAGKIQELVSAHDLVRERIELLQRQRYNLWACQQIRKAWKDFEENSNVGARMQTCLHFLGPIHPGLLDPVSLELYRDFLQTIRNKLSQELYQELSEKLAVEQRKLLADL